MALLGAAFLFFVAALALIQSLVVRNRGRAKFVLLAMLVIAGAYLAAILIFSLASHEAVLARGEEKHFCEIDCHLAYSVINTRQSKTLGNPPASAQGTYTVVTVKTRFDETTISPRRGDGLLYPNSRVLTLIDERGNKYSPSVEGQRAHDAAPTNGKPLATPLRPGQSYTTEIVFDLPADAKASTLLINDFNSESQFCIWKTTMWLWLAPASRVCKQRVYWASGALVCCWSIESLLSTSRFIQRESSSGERWKILLCPLIVLAHRCGMSRFIHPRAARWIWSALMTSFAWAAWVCSMKDS